MSGYRFQRAAIESADTPWRALDRAVARWVLAHGGDDRLASIAAWASYVEGLGDTALPLLAGADRRVAAPTLSEVEVQSLRATALVGDGSTATPFVIDADGRFYLWRNYALEGAIATQVRARLRSERVTPAVHSDVDLDILFGDDRSAAVRDQRKAVNAAIAQRLFVLTGGPGTGKTSTVLRMLLMLQRQASAAPSIALCAPTGKAAQRLLQALRDGKRALAQTLPADWQAALAAIPDQEALTVHRLLGFSPQRNTYARHRADPIAADIVVVDEASMVDLAMLQALLDALRPEATLILVGDADQLTSVAAGTVLQDLVQVLERTHPEQVVRLVHSFRAARHLLAINDAVRAGDNERLHTTIGAAAAAARLVPCPDKNALARQAARWSLQIAALGIRDVTVSTRAPGEHALEALRALATLQVLCALREEDSGALAINRMIEQRLRALWQVPMDRHWYAGRAVMITRNDYAAGLFNGDIGIALADAHGEIHVWFEAQDPNGQPHARAFAPASLPEHEGAFAITIHKSQGSEYDRVAVVLPLTVEHRILSRQLLYTGLSRARQEIEIWGSDNVLDAALRQVAIRHGGLASRLL